MLVSVIVVGSAISNYAEISADVAKINKRLIAFNQLDVCKMIDNNWGTHDSNNNSSREKWSIDKSQFLAFMLCETNDIDRADIDPILHKFDELLQTSHNRRQSYINNNNNNNNINNQTLKEKDIKVFANNLKNRDIAQTVTAYSGLPIVLKSIKQSFMSFCCCDNNMNDINNNTNYRSSNSSNPNRKSNKSNISALFDDNTISNSNSMTGSDSRSSSRDGSFSTFTHTSRGKTIATTTTVNSNRTADVLLGASFGSNPNSSVTSHDNNINSSSPSSASSASNMEAGVLNPLSPVSATNEPTDPTSRSTINRSTTGTEGGGYSNEF